MESFKLLTKIDNDIFFYIGIIFASHVFLKFASKIFHALKVYAFPTYPDFSKYGKWSVITGATDGIGKALAFELASRGQNIILIARNPQKLQNTANEIVSKHSVQTKILKIDFSHDESIYDEIKDFLKGFDIGILINNVGIVPIQVRFATLTAHFPEFLRDSTRVNMISIYKMTEIVLPGMVKRRRGLIINMSSSVAGRHMFTVYGATKAFADYFSQALSYEYEDKGVTVQSCLPGYVHTNMNKEYSYNNMFTISPESYVRSLLATVDKERRTYGCWQHSLQMWLMKLVPGKIFHWLIEIAKTKLEEKHMEKQKTS